jgi:hypothetical protein
VLGHAMKAADTQLAFGSMIGKAVNTLDDGCGTVNVAIIFALYFLGKNTMFSVKAVAAGCLDKSAPLSLRRDVMGVYANHNPQTRSLKTQLNLVQNKPLVRVVLVTIQGATPTFQRDLDTAN